MSRCCDPVCTPCSKLVQLPHTGQEPRTCLYCRSKQATRSITSSSALWSNSTTQTRPAMQQQRQRPRLQALVLVPKSGAYEQSANTVAAAAASTVAAPPVAAAPLRGFAAAAALPVGGVVVAPKERAGGGMRFVMPGPPAIALNSLQSHGAEQSRGGSRVTNDRSEHRRCTLRRPPAHMWICAKQPGSGVAGIATSTSRQGGHGMMRTVGGVDRLGRRHGQRGNGRDLQRHLRRRACDEVEAAEPKAVRDNVCACVDLAPVLVAFPSGLGGQRAGVQRGAARAAPQPAVQRGGRDVRLTAGLVLQATAGP
jgi:hypothetical protein